MRTSLDFTAGPFTCSEYWQATAIGVYAMYPPLGNRARIAVLAAYPQGDPGIRAIAEGTEVYSFKIIINNTRTTGLGACEGCTDEACIVLREIKISQPPPVQNIVLTVPATSQHVVWHSWSPIGYLSCPYIVPVRARTWGSIKTLYR